MKKQKKFYLVLLFLITALTITALASCSAGSNTSKDIAQDIGGGDYWEEDGSGLDPGYAPAPEGAEAEPSSDDALDFSATGRKIIKEYSYTIETQSFDESLNNILSAVDPADGYVLYSDIYAAGYSDDGPKRAQLQLRIPALNIPRFREQLGEAGRITNQGESGEDITDRYYDTEMRIRSLESQLNRLSALYEEADIMADIIEIQMRIDDVIFQLEYLKGDMQRMDHYVDYSTISISLEEVRDFTRTEGVSESLGDRVKNAFSQMLVNLRRGVENFVVNIVYFLPGIVIFIVILLVIILIVRSRKKRNRNYQDKAVSGYYREPYMPHEMQYSREQEVQHTDLQKKENRSEGELNNQEVKHNNQEDEQNEQGNEEEI
ncbi:MAG TPA: DUF4349 domain-containing protein [Clostridiaceae bacterium]|nr:DUF4349 domain-containing protein [Clostridiaceae bacterium]